ncbi:hypothetical protein CLV58_1593 [Spirosoma oryzae]|uniref:Oligosaccharide repeat unit polymerase n=2 Tax=Spirosoma oryzae TaxID=1469603 RepID=A0A2T0RGF4_9BACT|nr:hypothetical protein CLV58_1593 [Spirosoma oryzae]
MYFLLYKRYIYSILDPLFIYYVFTLSFSSVLVINVLNGDVADLIHFFLCHVFFFLGFYIVMNFFKKYICYTNFSISINDFFDYKVLKVTLYCLFGIYFIANTILFYTTGFPLLSDDPTVAKVENFVEGFGIILLINIGLGNFVLTTLLFFALLERKKIFFLLLLVVIILTALEGSKAGLIRILITFLLLVNHRFFSDKNITKKFKWITPLGLLLVLGVALIVLSKGSVDTDQTIFAFVRRLLYGADSILYFYLPVNQQYFDKFHFWEYIPYFFDQILGFLRIVTPKEALGNVMVMNAFPMMVGTIVGPNTAYYIEGQIFFGYFGAFLYSMIVGAVYAFIREYYFKANYYSAFWFVLICCIFQQASALTNEVTFFVSQVFYTLFFVVPVYLLVNLIIHGKIRFYKLHY